MSVESHPTGAELLARIRKAALQRRMSPSELVKPLTACPAAWLAQLGEAARPRPLTIARVEALIAGQPIPTEVSEGTAVASPLSHYERVVLQALSDAAEATMPCPTNTSLAEALGRSIGWSAGDIVKRLEKRGLIEVRRYRSSREVTIVATGRSTAQAVDAAIAATPAPAIPADVPRTVTRPAVTRSADRRRTASSREPCPYCNVRGDLGCRHQAPFEPVSLGARR